jgi:hypothetical protein
VYVVPWAKHFPPLHLFGIESVALSVPTLQAATYWRSRSRSTFSGALSAQVFMYVATVSSSLKFQTLVTVTSEVQLRGLVALPPGTLDGVIVSNRELEVSTAKVVFVRR